MRQPFAALPSAFGKRGSIIRPRSFLGRRIPVLATQPVGLIGAALFVRALFVRALLGLPGVARTVGDQKGSQLRSHVAARRIMFAQETWQRSGRNRFQETARTLVAGVTRTRKELGSAFARFEILRLRPFSRAREATGQKRDRRKNARSAQHYSLFSRCGKRFQCRSEGHQRRHLVADYPANGSALMAKRRGHVFPEYLLCIQRTSQRPSECFYNRSRDVQEPFGFPVRRCDGRIWFLRDRSSWWFRWTVCCVTSCGNLFAAER